MAEPEKERIKDESNMRRESEYCKRQKLIIQRKEGWWWGGEKQQNPVGGEVTEVTEIQ